MNPAFSVVLFTTLAGAAQGLVVALALADAGRRADGRRLPDRCAGRGRRAAGRRRSAPSFLHLGRPERAWRAVLMWRTSWLSREVIVLPAFIGLVALWWLALRADWRRLTGAAAAGGLAMAAALWWCTAMIYACIRFIQEWAHPLTHRRTTR